MGKKSRAKLERRAQRAQVRGAARPSGSLSKVLLGFTLAGLVGVVGLTIVLLRGGNDNPSIVADQPAESDAGPVHVHGLGINPADESLFIATHSGTWRVANGKSTAERVGDSYQDTMGFTVVGPNHFLGSGHPATADQPPLLGLIESEDAGKAWTSVSLYGEADFHVLRSAGRRIYGWDASNARLMASKDTGKSWTELPAPGSVVDLAPDPKAPSTILASTDRGLFRSSDEGRDWNRLSVGPIGFLAWPTPDRLYLVDFNGRVAVSRDQGRDWTPTGNIGGQPAAVLATGKNHLYAALAHGAVKQSTDGGATWTLRSQP